MSGEDNPSPFPAERVESSRAPTNTFPETRSVVGAVPQEAAQVHRGENNDRRHLQELSGASFRAPFQSTTHSDSVLTAGGCEETRNNPIPIRRRSTRAATFRPVQDFEEFDFRPGWHPGSEPGLDPTKPDGGHATMPTPFAPSEICVVDFSQSQISIQRFNNDSLVSFLEKAQPSWVKCRWVNVKGLSWDVIQALGRSKGLHRLAIEDILNVRNRTKVDWYPTHAFIIMTLQKLVHICDSDEEYSDSDDVSGKGSSTAQSVQSKSRVARWTRNVVGGTGKKANDVSRQGIEKGLTREPRSWSGSVGRPAIRTIQEYQGSSNEARTEYMRRHSTLVGKQLAVAAEQVCIFLTNDNTIISFFEMSVEEVENPIIRRLHTADTILRQSCDASMLGQAIIDAIIDLAIPVTACYSDVVGDLELDVLTRPNIDHTKSLYIIITEINKILSFINPIISLIGALRDHITPMTQEAATIALQNPLEGVIVTPMTNTYLGDVYDHCVLIADSLQQTRGSAEGMIDLIFNTISASQNESMKQLSVVSIIFLPLTFLTGYFGQNFQPFSDLDRGISFFWKIAVPVMVATVVVLMSQSIWEYFNVLVQRYRIGRLRKIRRRKKKRV